MSSIYQEFAHFLACEQSNNLELSQQVTSDRVAQLLYRMIGAEFSDSSCFGNDYFKEILHQVAETIMNVVYRKQQVLVNVEHLVAFTSIVQFIVHSTSIALPHSILTKLDKYMHSFITMQNVTKMRMVYQDSLNSAIIANFYKNIYLTAYQYRYRTIIKEYGIQQRSCFLARHLLQDIIEKNEVNIQAYESSVTCEWITLSLVYYILAAKCEKNKETPILSKIIQKYNSCKTYEQCQREINGKELCHFYNHVVLEKFARIETEQIDKMLDQCEIDPKTTANFIVSPILSDNNTVLDNIISSSWEP